MCTSFNCLWKLLSGITGFKSVIPITFHPYKSLMMEGVIVTWGEWGM